MDRRRFLSKLKVPFILILEYLKKKRKKEDIHLFREKF